MSGTIPPILAGKVVIVTGIGPGFGRVLALEAAKMGARVSLVSRSSGIMDEVMAEIAALGGESVATRADITSDADCAAVAKATHDRFGRIDALVNSAYLPGDIAPAMELSLDNLAAAFEVTVLGTMRMIRAVVPFMRAQKAGSIVNIGSQVARKVIPGQGGYGATKAALSVLSRHLATELGPDGIRVNTPAFGWTLTQPVRDFFAAQEAGGGPTVAEAIADAASAIALRRVPDEVECARAALLFASDLTSTVTGATLDVNGGDFMPL